MRSAQEIKEELLRKRVDYEEKEHNLVWGSYNEEFECIDAIIKFIDEETDQIDWD